MLVIFSGLRRNIETIFLARARVLTYGRAYEGDAWGDLATGGDDAVALRENNVAAKNKR